MVLATVVLYGLAFAGFSFAQSTTISLFVPGADTQPLVGSVIGSDKDATTYALQCAPGTDGSDCGFPGVFTLTEGPSTAVYAISEDIEASGGSTILAFTALIDCSLAGSSAVCTESYGGQEANDPGQSTETLTGTDFTYMPVVITAGSLNTNAPAAPSSTTAVPTASSTGGADSSSQTGSSTGPTQSVSGTAQSGSSSAKSTSASTGGMPTVTGHKGWVVGGAALAAALL